MTRKKPVCDLCGNPPTERDIATGGFQRQRNGKWMGLRVCERCELAGVDEQDRYTRERILSHTRECVLSLAN